MMRLQDASKLAGTKLKTRKVRLTVTVVISGVLMALLAAGSFIIRGTIASTENFSKEGFGSRYLIQGTPIGIYEDFGSNPSLIAKAKQLQKEEIAKKKALAKELNIAYDEKSETPATSEQDGPNGKAQYLNTDSTIGKKVMNDYYKQHPLPGLKELKESATTYGAIDYFQTQPIALGGDGPSLQVLKKGKETYKQQDTSNQYDGFSSNGLDGFTSSWALMNTELLKPFMLPGASSDVKNGRLPIVIPFSAAEELAGLKALPKTAKPEEKLQRVKHVREQAAEIQFSVCVRNATSYNEIQNTVIQQAEMKQNAKNKEYTAPSLQFGLPQKACGPVRITKDTRTTFEKDLAAKQEKFDRAFGKAPPSSKILKFRVIGLSPDQPDYTAFSVDQLITSMLSSTIGQNWFTPIELKEQNKTLGEIFPDVSNDKGFGRSYIAEFPDVASARNFYKNANCSPGFSFTTDPIKECAKKKQHFMLSPYGSSSIALEELKSGFGKFFRTAVIVVAVIASIIIIGTIGRIIADSRRETAVFRAIGAKRSDIAQIYLTYTLYLTLLIGTFAVGTGFLLAFWANSKMSDSLSVSSVLAFNTQDLTKRFTLVGFELKDIGYLVGLTIVAGLVSAVLPLLSNLKRSPVQDMRDEN